MGRLQVDYQRVHTGSIPRLDHAISYLSNATTNLNQMSIPSNYNYRSDLNRLINDIEDISRRVKRVRDFIEESHKRLEIIEDENKSYTDSIDSIIIKERVKIVRNS